MSVHNLVRALNFLCDAIGKKDIPLYWVTLILLVYEAGEKGITTKEASESINMTQGIASRTVKLLSRYLNANTKQLDGFDILIALQNDMENRQRQRIYLSEHGKQIVKEMLKILEK